MTTVREPKDPALRSLYWREEVLEVVLWLRGGGFDDHLDAVVLRDFLGVEPAQATAHLQRLAAQGYLCVLPDGRYAVTAFGEEEAQRLVGGPRAVPLASQRLVGGPRAVPLASQGTCGPACWCSTSPVESWRCASSALT